MAATNVIRDLSSPSDRQIPEQASVNTTYMFSPRMHLKTSSEVLQMACNKL